MFASGSVAVHLLRGVLGFALLAAAVFLADPHPGWALPAFGLALIALRGCPMCWTLGLFETASCANGSCAKAFEREQ